MERMTTKNPNGVTYRMLIKNAGMFKMAWQQEMLVFFGDAVDRLGEYEDLGTVGKFKELLEKERGIKKTGAAGTAPEAIYSGGQ